jgi:hypothetical protein
MTKTKTFAINLTAEERAAKWLADANEQAEKGNHEKAERMYEKSQYWLDRANKDRGWGE